MIKARYAAPIILIPLFPVYLKFVSQQYSWVTADSGAQFMLGLITVTIVGFGLHSMIVIFGGGRR